MSHFLYIHKDLSGDPAWNKVGVSLTPYSAVRARQKFCSKEFTLDHLYFGREIHIAHLEEIVKDTYRTLSGKVITDRGQTELFKLSQEKLVEFIDATIIKKDFHIHKVQLKKPYSASKSSVCPFGVPGELQANDWANRLVEEKWGKSNGQILLEGLEKVRSEFIKC